MGPSSLISFIGLWIKRQMEKNIKRKKDKKMDEINQQEDVKWKKT